MVFTDVTGKAKNREMNCPSGLYTTNKIIGRRLCVTTRPIIFVEINSVGKLRFKSDCLTSRRITRTDCFLLSLVRGDVHLETLLFTL